MAEQISRARDDLLNIYNTFDRKFIESTGSHTTKKTIYILSMIKIKLIRRYWTPRNDDNTELYDICADRYQCKPILIYSIFICKYYLQAMNDGTIKLLDTIVNSLFESDLDTIDNLANNEEIPQPIANGLKNIATIYRELIQARIDTDNHNELYKTIVIQLAQGETITEQFINDQIHINHDRRQQMVALIRTIDQIKQENDKKQQELQNLEIQHQQLQLSYADIRQSSSKFEIDYERSIRQNKELTDKSMILQSVEEQQMTQIKQLEQELLNANQQIVKLKQEVEKKGKGIGQQGEKQLIRLRQQNEKLKEKVSTFENEKRSVISAIERQDLIRSEEVSWVSEISESHMKQKNMLEQKEQIIKRLQEALRQKESALKSKNRTLNNKQQQLQEKEQALIDKEKIIEELQQSITQLSTKKSIIDSKPLSEIFVDKNSMITYLGLDHNCGISFIETMTKEVGKISSMTSLYNYSHHKRENFHKRVNNKHNILLICQTEEGKLLGGFTTAGISLSQAEPKNTKAFLFTFEKEEMKIHKLKASRQSTIFDYDFIIFGEEELCIENGSDQLSSYWVSGQSKCLNYQSGTYEERENFLSSSRSGTTTVRLINYELIELTFDA